MEQLNLKQFGENLRKVREFKGFSREQLADLVDSTSRTLAKYEIGQADPTLGKILDMAKALDVSVETLMGLHNRAVFNSFNNNTEYSGNYNTGQQTNGKVADDKLIEQYEKRIAVLEARAIAAERTCDDLRSDKIELRKEVVDRLRSLTSL